MQNNNENQEYEVWDQLREEEEYWDYLAKKYLLNEKGLFIFNEYEILKNNDISESQLQGLKNYLINKYGTLEITEL
jgi:hypothetical protein